MKNSLLALVAGFFLLFACQKSDDDSPDFGKKTTIEFGETVDFESGVSITFDSLLSDSRCPCEAMCVWAGEVVVQLSGTVNGVTFICPFVLGAENPPASPVEKIFNGYKFSVFEVLPYPCGLSYPIPAADYKVKIMVSKVD